MLWTILAFVNGLLLVFLLFSNRKRRKNEPPLDKGLIPWLGHALEFRKDAAKFLAGMKEKHGNIFTVRVAGMYLTLLLDPVLFDSVLNDAASLKVGKSRNKMLEQTFGLKQNCITDNRRWMEKHFHAQNLSQLCTKMKTQMENVLMQDLSRNWRQDGLFSLCYSLLFRAGYLSLFDSEGDASAVYEEFRKFDDRIAKLARESLKHDERKLFMSAREKLWDQLGPKPPGAQRAATLCWQQEYVDFLQKEGVDDETQRRDSLLQLWTTQCNAGPAAFWLLGFLLTHPEAMQAVASELSGLSAQDSGPPEPPSHSTTPVFDSVLSETLRLRAAVMINRDVVQDKSVRVADGREYLLRKGDKVCLFPFLSPQMDPEIHPQPQIFKYDRFLNGEMTVKNTFYKDGRPLKHYSLPWGAGGNVCVGKDFAVFTIKQFVLLVLTRLDLELCEPGARLPPVDPSRYGFGMLHPLGDLRVRCRLKTT
ncbi:unnamed protein product [Knipowitschia caucasica]